jgi:HPt (histidine-containing phosphotransfer) domain-containing protein
VNPDDRLTDQAMLLQAVGDNRDAFRDLLRLFIAIFPGMVNRLEDFFAAEDVANVAQQAHCVKGCLYLVGAMPSADKVEVIEAAARHDKVLCSCVEFERLMDEMRCVIAEVEGDLKPATLPSVEEIC